MKRKTAKEQRSYAATEANTYLNDARHYLVRALRLARKARDPHAEGQLQAAFAVLHGAYVEAAK